MEEGKRSYKKIRETKVKPLHIHKPRSRTTEMQWLGSHIEFRQKLAGQWVAIEGERLVAHGARLKDVLELSKDQGVEHPFVVCLPELGNGVIIV